MWQQAFHPLQALQCLAARLKRTEGWRRNALLFLLGAISTLALAPFGLMPVMFVTIPGLVWLMDGALDGRSWPRRMRSAFWCGWWFGFGYFVAGLWWLAVALLKDAVHFAWAVPFAVFGLPAFLAVFYGLALALAALFWRTGGFRLVALGVAMVVAEWLRGHVATGFPWNAIGYSAVPTPLFMQSDRLLGIYLLGGVATFVFAAPAVLADRRGRIAVLAAAVTLFVANIGYGAFVLAHSRVETGKALTVRLVQPNFEQSMWNSQAGRDQIFMRLLAMTGGPSVDEGGALPAIIVWPESTLPFLLEERPDARTAIGETLRPGQILIVGGARFAGRRADGRAEFYNAIDVLNDNGLTVSTAGKTHLVPFGEYLPFETFLDTVGLGAISSFAGNYTPVENRQMLILPDGLKLFPLICYEAIFPRLLLPAASEADALINITYDSWFGRTTGPYQHFAQARMRAVEARKPLIRVGENGVSAIVDGYGRVVARTQLDQTAVLDVEVKL